MQLFSYVFFVVSFLGFLCVCVCVVWICRLPEQKDHAILSLGGIGLWLLGFPVANGFAYGLGPVSPGQSPSGMLRGARQLLNASHSLRIRLLFSRVKTTPVNDLGHVSKDVQQKSIPVSSF